jgi:hypothetical protein
MKKSYTVVLIIPTGVGASIGGYAGDGIPVAKAIAQVCDRLITHPNVLNGAQLYWNLPNTLYVEGYALDKFASNHWGLQKVNQNRVGLILDRGIEKDLRLRHLQATDGARATLGLPITDYIITDAPLNIELTLADSGASWGTIGNPDSLLRAAEKLITQRGINALAVVARFPDETETLILQNYRQGMGVDPLAGAEAIISHLIVRQFEIPCAHAPALNPLPLDSSISPRSAAEELGYTFLPCVLVGLSQAPQFITTRNPYLVNDDQIWADQVDALVIPANACGGSGILSFSDRPHVKIITVKENQTKMNVKPEDLGMKTIEVNSYLEALGVLVMDRAGMDERALCSKISSIPELRL